MNHKFSVESLVHYQCQACKQWWTIGDGPITGSLTCPNPECRSTFELVELEDMQFGNIWHTNPLQQSENS